MTISDSIRTRFWAKVDKSCNCWLWTHNKNPKGYGRFYYNASARLAHRVSWEIAHGPIPEGPGHHGICVLHKCDTPSCVNPSHLFLGTNADNIRDMHSKGRFNIHGRNIAKGERHGNARITSALASLIRLNRHQSAKDISSELHVSLSLVNKIRGGYLWRDIWQA